MSLLSTLLTPRRLLALALAAVFAVVAVLLGNWQYSRHEAKVAARDRVEQHYDAEPVPLTSALTSAEDPLGPAQDWTRVEVTGHYLVDEQLLVRNRPHRGVYGYAVVVPFVPEGPAGSGAEGRAALLVDRGWVRNAADASTLPDVPPVPDAELTVTGWLRPGEEDLEREMPEGQLASINLTEASQRTGNELYNAYLVLDAESVPSSATAPERPAAADPPDTGLGTHFAYALQWWLTAPLGVVLVVLLARRDAREAGGPANDIPRKPKRTRIWDDEDE
ncbi:MAG: SURF1 family protein [Actinobacteria bacterium]|nr:SURF1 family protein [Actinomycetota bacterium]